MAIKRTVELNIKSDTKEAEKSIDNIADGIEDIKLQAKKAFDDKALKKFNKEADKTKKVSIDVRQKLRDIQNEMAEIGDVGSAKFQSLAKEAGMYKDQMNNANAAIKSMSADFPKLQVGVQALQAMAGAAQGVTAGMALFGSENEEVQKSIQKMMAIQSLMNSVTSISNLLGDESAIGLKIRTMLTNRQTAAEKKGKLALVGTMVAQKAMTVVNKVAAIGMKALNLVMSLNPVFLLIAAFALLAGAFAFFTSNTDKAAEMSDKFNESLERGQKLLDRTNKKILEDSKHRLSVAKALGKSEEELHGLRLGLLTDEDNARKAQLELQKYNITELRKLKSLAFKEGNMDLVKEKIDEINTAKEKYKDLSEQHRNFVQGKQLENIAYSKHIKDEQKKRRDTEEADKKERIGKYKTFLQEKRRLEATALAVQREIDAGEIALMQDDFDRKNSIIENNFKVKRENLIADQSKTQKQKEALQLLYDDQESNALKIVMDTKLAAELEAETTRQERMKELLASGDANFNDPMAGVDVAIEVETIKHEAMFALREEYKKKENESDKEWNARKMALVDRHLEHASGALNSLDSLNTLITDAAVAKAGDNEAAAEKARKNGFERSKKLQLGMAIITGIQGVMAAFTAGSSMGPAGVVMGPLMAGLAAVTAGVNLAKISKTRYQGGASSISAATGSTSAPRVPSFNIAGNSTENQLAQSLGSQNQAPVEAFVVAGNVTTAQSLDRNKIETISL